MNIYKKLAAIFITALVILGNISTAFAVSDESVSNAVKNTAEFLVKSITKPQVSTVGGEWMIIGLARSGCELPKGYFDDYYKNVEKYVKDKKGVLSDKKYTDYSRLILALTAIGRDPSNVGGYNLLEPLGDFESTIQQGINGPIFALLALDSGEYQIPVCKTAKTQATRNMYIEEILSKQLDDGGFALSGEFADPDVTSTVLQALAKYQSLKAVEAAIKKAVSCLSKIQETDGGYKNRGIINAESAAQVLIALCELGIKPNDPRFVKNNKSVLDNLFSFYKKDSGFKHAYGDNVFSVMSAEQALCALVSLQRVQAGKPNLYSMTDVVKASDTDSGSTLSYKHKDVKVKPIIFKEKTFADIKGHPNQAAIEALSQRGIISGISENRFAPDSNITRAEFATIVTKALGLIPSASSKFKDVPKTAWYAAFIGTANSYGIVSGLSADTFGPDKAITRQEAAVMTANAAGLCGLDADMSTMEIRDMLAQFSDYIKSADWARAQLAFCYKHDILDQSELNIEPLKPATRAEIAEMLYRMLALSNLLH